MNTIEQQAADFATSKYVNPEKRFQDWLNVKAAYLAGASAMNGTVTGETSDGFHSFNELYEFRKVYNAALFNEWYSTGKYEVHKSLRHFDGELCFGGGWFIVVAQLPTGQITNHYKEEDWDLFKIMETEKALFEFDGHTASDTLDRLKALKPSAMNGSAAYQKCPKCDGQGSVSKPPWLSGDIHEWSSTAATFVCDVCNGAKIIPTPASPSPLEAETADRFPQEKWDKMMADIQAHMDEWDIGARQRAAQAIQHLSKLFITA